MAGLRSRAPAGAIIIPIAVAAAVALVVRAWASASFFDAFFANFVATVAGIVAGVPLSLWLAQRELSSYEAAAAQKAASEATARRQTILRLLRAEIQENLTNLSQRVGDGGVPRQHLVPFLRRDVWEAMSDGGELRWIDDPQILGALSTAYHWIGTNIYLESRHYEAVLAESPLIAYAVTPTSRVQQHLIATDPHVKAAMDVAMERLNDAIEASKLG